MSASKAAPGPGQYLGTESTWDKRQRARARHLGPKHGGRAPGAPPPRGGGIAFDSTSTRFDGRGLGGRSATAAGASIGPGSYDHPGLAEDVGKRLTSRTGAFGTSTPGQEKGAKFPTSKAHISASFHSFWLIFGRAIISRNGLEAWMLFPERARAEHSS